VSAVAVYSDKHTQNLGVRYKITGPYIAFPLLLSTHLLDMHENGMELQHFVLCFVEIDFFSTY
jgi:hypothetical protein